MPPIYRYHIGQNVCIIAQQSTGQVIATGRSPVMAQNYYIVEIDPDQPLVTSNGTYTAFEDELKPA